MAARRSRPRLLRSRLPPRHGAIRVPRAVHPNFASSPTHVPPSRTTMTTVPEASARVLIDRALTDGGWDLTDPTQVELEAAVGTGRADYLLRDDLGRVLCVLEAKRADLDPYDAKDQARGYAENL